MQHVALHTCALLKRPLGSPELADYEAMTPALFDDCQIARGFVRLVDWAGVLRPSFARSEEHVPVSTLTTWADLESAFAFSYGGAHATAMRRRKEWFLKPDFSPYVLWWVEGEHAPSWVEAVERHEHLHQHGPMPFAFTFQSAFDGAGSVVRVRKAPR